MLKNIIKNVLIYAIIICVYTSVGYASKLDAYKDLIRNKEFTIAYTYETEIPTLFHSNPETSSIEGKIYFEDYSKAIKYYSEKFCIPNMTQLVVEESIKDSNGIAYINSSTNNSGAMLRNTSLPAGGKGIAIISKDNMYSECVTTVQSIHHLKKGIQYIGWKSYNITGMKRTYTSLGESWIVGMHNRNSVINASYKPYDIYSELNYGINLGSTLITRYINAILPDEEHAVYVPSFKLINATPEYEDYQTNNDGKKEVVRYCFDGDKLTQIMAAVAGYKADGTPDVHQYKITINQFDNQVDPKYFEVPDYIKIKK